MGGDRSGEDSSQDLSTPINKESGNKRKFLSDVSVETSIDQSASSLNEFHRDKRPTFDELGSLASKPENVVEEEEGNDLPEFDWEDYMAHHFQEQFDESASSLNEFHGHKRPTLDELGSLDSKPENVVEEEEDDDLPEFDWEDHIAHHFQEQLTDNLLEIFKTAIKKVIEYGYNEVAAGWAVLNSVLSRGTKDVVSNIVDDALALLKAEKECNILKEPVFDGSRSSAKHFVLEMTNVILEARPDLTKKNAMRCLLMSDMNLLRACSTEEGLMPSSSGHQDTREKGEATSHSK